MASLSITTLLRMERKKPWHSTVRASSMRSQKISGSFLLLYALPDGRKVLL